MLNSACKILWSDCTMSLLYHYQKFALQGNDVSKYRKNHYLQKKLSDYFVEQFNLSFCFLLNPFPNKPWFFMCMLYKSFENTVGKEGIGRDEQFIFSNSVFYLFEERSAIFIEVKIVVCKLFQFERVQNLLFLKGLK